MMASKSTNWILDISKTPKLEENPEYDTLIEEFAKVIYIINES